MWDDEVVGDGSADAASREKKTGSRVVGACIVRPAFFFSDGVVVVRVDDVERDVGSRRR
jgi:predicted cupin superfamily sugar epimerase